MGNFLFVFKSPPSTRDEETRRLNAKHSSLKTDEIIDEQRRSISEEQNLLYVLTIIMIIILHFGTSWQVLSAACREKSESNDGEWISVRSFMVILYSEQIHRLQQERWCLCF